MTHGDVARFATRVNSEKSFVGSGPLLFFEPMQSNRIVYIIFFSLAGLLGVFFIATGGRSSGLDARAGAGSGDADAAALLAGGSMTGPRGNADSGDFSLLDSEFMKMGVPNAPIPDDPAPKKKESGEPDILEPVSKDNPINPQTGSQYTDAMMDSFSEMREKMPNNSIIPKKMTEEDKALERQKNRELSDIRLAIGRGEATQDQVTRFYDHEMKLVQDREEIIDYIMTRSKNMAPELKEQYDKIVLRNQETRKRLQEEREKAMSKF